MPHGSGDEGQDGHGGNVGHGDVPGDDLADHQVHAAQQQHQRGNLAQGAADAAQEHIYHGIGAGEGGEVAVLHHGQGVEEVTASALEPKADSLLMGTAQVVMAVA